jgi:hypothetical protein
MGINHSFFVTPIPTDLKIFRLCIGWNQNMLKKFGFTPDQVTRIEHGKNEKQARKLCDFYNGIIWSLPKDASDALKAYMYYNLNIHRQYPELYGGYTDTFIRKNFIRVQIENRNDRVYWLNQNTGELKSLNDWTWPTQKSIWELEYHLGHAWDCCVIPYLNKKQKLFDDIESEESK